MVLESGQRLAELFVAPSTVLSDVTCEKVRLTHDASSRFVLPPPSTNLSDVSCEALIEPTVDVDREVMMTSRPAADVLEFSYSESVYLSRK